jgi:hypothetical protein
VRQGKMDLIKGELELFFMKDGEWRTDTANQRGREWMGVDKNSSRRRWGLHQDDTTSNTCLRLTTQVGQAHATTGVLLDLGTNKQPSEPKHANTNSGNLHGLLPVLHR